MWLLHFCRSGTSQNLEVAGRLINVIVEANIFGWNDIGMLCNDNQYSSTLFWPFFFTVKANISSHAVFELTSLRD
jgi:hypothetical protein